MTATLVATLIEDDVLTWDTTIADALPELVESIHEDYRSVAVEQLLQR